MLSDSTKMDLASEILLALLQSALTRFKNISNQFPNLDEQMWKSVYDLAITQGVLAIAYEGLCGLPENKRPSRSIYLQWAYNVELIENKYQKQKNSAFAFADLMIRDRIEILCLKGLAISRYYPIPQHRQFGDLDCYTFGGYHIVNEKMQKLGIKVRFDNYKHSSFDYLGLDIENHKFCTGIRGFKWNRHSEKILQNILLRHAEFEHIDDSPLLCPPAEFDALFLIKHAFAHFLPEGVGLRTLCDWACFLNKQQHNVDWEQMYHIYDECHLRRFTDALTDLAVRYLGLEITNSGITRQSKFSRKLLVDMLYNQQRIFSSQSHIALKYMQMVRSMIRNKWRYNDIYDVNCFHALGIAGLSIIVNRKPHL